MAPTANSDEMTNGMTERSSPVCGTLPGVLLAPLPGVVVVPGFTVPESGVGVIVLGVDGFEGVGVVVEPGLTVLPVDPEELLLLFVAPALLTWVPVCTALDTMRSEAPKGLLLNVA